MCKTNANNCTRTAVRIHYLSVLHARPRFKTDLFLLVVIANKNISNTLKI